jgi:predicted amidohydrolase
MNFYVACNRVGSDASGGFVGNSCIADPHGCVLADSQSDEEEIIMATLEKEAMLEARAHFTYFGQRRPELYKRLIESS